MRIGFIGLGNVGGKLAGSILRNGHDLVVRDLDRAMAQPFLDQGADWADSPRAMAESCDMVITCLPSPAACAAVMEAEDGLLAGLSEGKIWAEMSTTDATEVRRMAEKVIAKGAHAIDCPVSGGCHRAATGNISIFAGCSRDTFERALPILTTLGRRVLHTGDVGSASLLKVMTSSLETKTPVPDRKLPMRSEFVNGRAKLRSRRMKINSRSPRLSTASLMHYCLIRASSV